jgi:hypothetical protein
VRRVLVIVAAVLAVGMVAAPAFATTPADPDDPADSGTGAAPPSSAPSAPLIPVVPGCPDRPVASAVFAGRVVAIAKTAARFSVQTLRAGALTTFGPDALVDVQYTNETQYLRVGDTYLVGVAPTGNGIELTSKVRADDPLFGGDAVIGATEQSAACPDVEDPVRTLHLDGTEIDAGILTSFTDDTSGIAMAFVVPIAAAFGIVLALVLLRWLLTGVVVTFRRAAAGDDGFS